MDRSKSRWVACNSRQCLQVSEGQWRALAAGWQWCNEQALEAERRCYVPSCPGLTRVCAARAEDGGKREGNGPSRIVIWASGIWQTTAGAAHPLSCPTMDLPEHSTPSAPLTIVTKRLLYTQTVRGPTTPAAQLQSVLWDEAVICGVVTEHKCWPPG